MSTVSRSSHSLRVLVVTIALALVGTVGGDVAGDEADVLTPLEDVGSPGGGGGFAIDETERAQNLQELTGGESTFTGIAPAEMPTAGDALAAINGRGQVAFEETERALAGNAIASAGVAEQAQSPAQAITAF